MYFLFQLGSPQFLMVNSDFWFLFVVLLLIDFFFQRRFIGFNILVLWVFLPAEYYFPFVLHPSFSLCNYFHWLGLVIQWLVFLVVLLSSCSRTVPSAIWEIFSDSLIFCNVLAKYEKRGKYLPMLHEATRDNNFIVQCLLKSNTRFFFFIRKIFIRK